MRTSYLLKSKSYLIVACFVWVITGLATAQDFEYEGYSWDKDPTPFALPDSLSEEDAIYRKYHFFVEFNANVESVNQQYNVEHYKLYLNSEKAVEANNRIYIAQEDENDKHNQILIRVVQPDGTINLLDKNNIKTGVHEESGTEFLYYAIENLQVGSEIEALIKRQVYPQFYGRLFYIQKSHPIFDYRFEYIAPGHLAMEFKTYNTSKTFKSEDRETSFMHTIAADYVPKYQGENLSSSGANKEYFIYKLDRNVAQGSNDVNGFGYYSQIVGNRGLNGELSKTAFKSIAESYKTIGVKESDSKTLKALKIENFIKENFTFIDNNTEASLEDVDAIFKQRAINTFGAARLYIEYLYNAGLSCEMIATCDKTSVNFDKEFENYLFLNKMLLYIPEIKTALDPSDSYSRLQYFDTEYQGHPGLFIKSRTLGNTRTATGKVKMIPATKGSESLTKAIIDVEILDDFEDINVKVKQETSGHIAKNFQPFFPGIEDDVKEDFHRYVLHSYTDQLKMKSVKFENTEALDFPQRPLKASCELENEDFWQKAGHNYILNAGALIGPQSQMYSEDESARRTPINSSFARRFQYEITFNVPANYEISNIESLDMDVDGSNGDYTFYFKSSHTRTGDVVKVVIDELYDHDLYPADQFSAYQKVINAAADFSKKKVIFKPK